jgi:vacuolar protein sorting-associated protein 51
MSTAPLSPSPRQSLSVRSPISSSRTSLDQSNTSRPTSTRRNRAALRDYYNLKPSSVAEDAPESVTSPSSDRTHREQTILDEVDREGFEAGAFVRGVLEREALEGVLRVENGLVSEIRGLDGERKALVYDNYSKLIRATETIRKVQASDN